MNSVEDLLRTTFSGRRFTRKQLAQVQETIQRFPNLSRTELARTVCEHLNWKTPNGRDKVESCLTLLAKLEAQGVVTLPAKQARQAPQRRVPVLENDPPETSMQTALSALTPIRLEAVGSTGPDRERWKAYVQTYHYLGYRQPIGSHLGYFIVSQPRQQRLGCLLFSASAAWALAPRDHWIGWDDKHRKKLLHLVLSNDRFLIFPWVQVPNLASHALSLATQQIGDDWVRAFGYRPVVIDTLMLMLLIFRLVCSKNTQSYGTTIDDLWDNCQKLNLALPQKNSIAPSSFCAARQKLDEAVFKCANQKILAAYAPDASHYGWLGHRLFAVDGSKINLPRELLACGYSTPTTNAHYPQGLLSCLYQLKSQLPFDFDLTSHANERLSAMRHLQVLQTDDVVVYDRGYFSYVLLHRHAQTGIHAIFRLEENSYNEIKTFFASAETDTQITLLPSPQRQTEIRSEFPDLHIVPLKLRLLKYKIADTLFCLGTTVLDVRYPLQEFIDVYHGRWSIEELYKVSKRIFIIEDFHGKTERGVKQELFAHFVLITLNRLFANRADIELNPGPASTSQPPDHASPACWT